MKRLKKFKRPDIDPPVLLRKRGQWSIEFAEDVVEDRMKVWKCLLLPRASADGLYPRLYWLPYSKTWEVVASVKGKKITSTFDDRRTAVIEYLSHKK